MLSDGDEVTEVRQPATQGGQFAPPSPTKNPTPDLSSLLEDSALGMEPPTENGSFAGATTSADPTSADAHADVHGNAHANAEPGSCHSPDLSDEGESPVGSSEMLSHGDRASPPFFIWLRKLIPGRGMAARHDSQDPSRARKESETWIDRPAQPTKLGNRTLALLVPLIAQPCTFPTTLFESAAARLPGPTGRLIDQLARDVHDGLDLERLLRQHRRAFGDLPARFVAAGQDSVGARDALIRYVRHRQQLEMTRRSGLHDGISTRTRRFSLTLSELLEMNGRVDLAVEGAALEMPRRLRARLRVTRDRIRYGESIADALPVRGLFAEGFEHRFVRMVEAGDRLSSLPSLMRAIALG